MKLDTSSYYPKSPLDDDDSEEWISGEDKPEIQDVSIDAERPSEVIDVQVPETVVIADSEVDSQFLVDDGTPESPTNNVIDKCCTLLSWVFVPLLMPLYGLLLAFNLSILTFMPISAKWTYALITVGITVILPMLLIFMLKKAGVVHDIGLNGRKERFLPYLISILSMGGLGWFMWTKGAPMWLVMFYGGGAVAGAVNTIVNFRWKISAHAAGIAGVVALLIRIISTGFPLPSIQGWLIASIVVSGLLGSARIWQGRHTMWQVLAGYVVGFTSVILMTLI